MQMDAGKRLCDEGFVSEGIGRGIGRVGGGERKNLFVKRDVPRNIDTLSGYVIAAVAFVLVGVADEDAGKRSSC
jgi:hypothetical protein